MYRTPPDGSINALSGGVVFHYLWVTLLCFNGVELFKQALY
jgi:hypothetical protein